MPSLTPQTRLPRCLILSSVWAVAAPAPSSAVAKARPATRRRRVVRRESVMCVSLHFWSLAHHHLGADGNPVEQVDDVRIDEAEAARGHRLADGLRLVGAVDAIPRLAEIERAGAERIARPAGHEARQIGLSFDHL